MRNKTSNYALNEHLPRSRKKIDAGPGNIITLVDALEETICVPSDPRTMDPQVLEAWYTMFVDESIPEESRFRWTNTKAATVPRGNKIPASIKVNILHTRNKPSQTNKGKTKAKPSTTHQSRRQVDDEVLSSDRDDIPNYEGESETSAGEGPSDPRRRPSTVLRSGRQSAAPAILAPMNTARASKHQGQSSAPPPPDANANLDKPINDRMDVEQGEDLSTVARPTPHDQAALSPSLDHGLSALPATKNSRTTFFRLQPPRDNYPLFLLAQTIEKINTFEYFRDLPSLKDLDNVNGISLPHISDLITCCVELDLLFPVEPPESTENKIGQAEAEIDKLWFDLGDHENPLPTYLLASSICQKLGEPFHDAVIRPALNHIEYQLNSLNGLKMCSMEPGAPPTFQSWTEYLVSTARFLSFLYSIPPSFADPGLSEVVERQYARLVKIACVYLTYRYTTSTISSFISSYPKATSAPTIASLVSTLGTTWLNAAVHSFDTQYELEESIPNVLSQSWARQRDGFQPKNDLPFFQLHDTARRWLAINPSSTLEQAILGFIGELEETWEPFETLTTYHEFSLIAAVFAITLSPNRETPDH
ncbi:hypothetical protein M407DRAFT_32418, partial [Tulasnella calospora MUT 4182]